MKKVCAFALLVLMVSGTAIAQSDTRQADEKTRIEVVGVEKAVRCRAVQITSADLVPEFRIEKLRRDAIAWAESHREVQAPKERPEISRLVDQKLSRSLSWWSRATWMVWRGGW